MFTITDISSRTSIACVIADASRILQIGSFSAVAPALVARPVPSWSSFSAVVSPGMSTMVDGATTWRMFAALLVRLAPPHFSCVHWYCEFLLGLPLDLAIQKKIHKG